MWLVAKFTLVFWSLFQINFPIHVIPFLIFKLKTFRKVGLIKLVVRLFKQMMQSILFMTTYVISIKFMHVVFATSIGKRVPNGLANWIISALSTIPIAWEQPHRRNDIIYFVLPRTLESYYMMAKNRNLIPKEYPRLQNILLIMLAVGAIAFKFAEENKTVVEKPIEQKPEEPQDDTLIEAESDQGMKRSQS